MKHTIKEARKQPTEGTLRTYLVKLDEELQQVKEKLDKMTSNAGDHHDLCYETIVDLLKETP